MKCLVRFSTAVIAALALCCTSVHAEDLTIVGTGDGVSALKEIGTSFTTAAGVNLVIPDSIGSGGGIKAVAADEAKIARVARKLKEKEAAQGLTYTPFARMPVVFFVHSGVTVDNLTTQQVNDIYAGKITSWKEVGGSDQKIRVVRREDGDSSLEALKETLSGFKDVVITEESKTAMKTGEMVDLIKEKADTIGFGPADVAAAKGLKALKLDGKTHADPGYPCFTTVALVYKEANNTGDIKKLVEFITSPAAKEAITKAGGKPL